MNLTCDNSPVPVNVYVTVNAHNVATCTCDPVQANMPSTPNASLAFTLVNPPAGWVLPANGAIVVTGGGTQFPEGAVVAADGLSATLYDANTDGALYTYTVVVVKSGTHHRVSHDPLIKNGGIQMGGN